jgi:predicted small lipoprotein YifL
MFAFGAAISLALGLAACGRKGGLDLPPSDTPSPQTNNLTQPSFGPSSMMPGSQQQQEATGPAPNAVDSHGNPIYQPPPKKSFILDPILQ